LFRRSFERIDSENETTMGKPSKSVESLTKENKDDAGSASDESSSLYSGSNSSDPSTTHHTQHSESTKVSLTHNETKAVKRSKVLVYLALLVAAVSVGLATYFLLRHSEEEDFQAGVSPR
jgi:hypothetical protein